MLFGEFLVAKNIIRPEDVEEALAIQKAQPEVKFGEALVTLELFDYDKLTIYIQQYIKEAGAELSEIETLLSQEQADALIRSLQDQG
ncbi:MAG: hypothetical protein D6767_04615 [Candidatus Hydrogenedentota bacterium]|nr:MAG: hypothetical protein D6767_04615 [Candidatus Hydrogenedentota bacterium]